MANIIVLRKLWLALVLSAMPLAAFAQAISVGVSIRVAPPALPVYVQPPCPTPGYLWTPGYWAYAPVSGYYWVPGVWVAPPQPGLLWTPGYWGFVGGVYRWHAGYWAPHVGFYGGINYGFGYLGVGFVGGVWAGNVFRYNTAVVNVNTTVIHDTYVNRTVINNTVVNNHLSFNGPGGIAARPTAQERVAMREQHIAATANQLAHQRVSAQNRSQWASNNAGRPGTAAMDRVNGHGFNPEGRAAGAAESERAHANAERRPEDRRANANPESRSAHERADGPGRSEARERHGGEREHAGKREHR